MASAGWPPSSWCGTATTSSCTPGIAGALTTRSRRPRARSTCSSGIWRASLRSAGSPPRRTRPDPSTRSSTTRPSVTGVHASRPSTASRTCSRSPCSRQATTTALITRPDRLVFLSSGMHHGGDPDLTDLQWTRRGWSGTQAYADSKLFDVVLALALARRWPGVLSNAVEPGWVPTKMGGPGAPDDLALGADTQAWLAVSSDPGATVSGSLLPPPARGRGRSGGHTHRGPGRAPGCVRGADRGGVPRGRARALAGALAGARVIVAGLLRCTARQSGACAPALPSSARLPCTSRQGLWGLVDCRVMHHGPTRATAPGRGP